MIGPVREERAEHAREGALAHRDAAGNADDVRQRVGLGAEEGVGGAVQGLGGLDLQVQQTRQRQVDRLDFVEGDPLVETLEFGEVAFRQGQRSVGA